MVCAGDIATANHNGVPPCTIDNSNSAGFGYYIHKCLKHTNIYMCVCVCVFVCVCLFVCLWHRSLSLINIQKTIIHFTHVHEYLH